MTDTQANTAPTDAAATDAPGLTPLLGSLDVLGGESAGWCSGGVCHVPSPAQRDLLGGDE